MNVIEINERIIAIQEELDKLKNERKMLELIKVDLARDWDTKFRIWWYSNLDEDEPDWYPSHEKFPTLNHYLDSMHMDRYRIYEIADLFADGELSFITDPDDNTDEEWYDFQLEISNNEPLVYYRKIAEELYNGKLKSFKCDW